MGRWVLIFEGTGSHHNGKPCDVETLAKDMIEELKAYGHNVTAAMVKFPDNTGDRIDLFEAKALPGELVESGAWFDSILKGLLGKMTLSFDRKKFIKHPKFREAIQDLAIAAKDSATLPADIDDIIIDQAVALLEQIIDQQQLSGPVEVGAIEGLPGEQRRAIKKRSKKEVIDEIVKLGGDPTDEKKFNPLILSLLMYLPALITFLKKLMGKE